MNAQRKNFKVLSMLFTMIFASAIMLTINIKAEAATKYDVIVTYTLTADELAKGYNKANIHVEPCTKNGLVDISNGVAKYALQTERAVTVSDVTVNYLQNAGVCEPEYSPQGTIAIVKCDPVVEATTEATTQTTTEAPASTEATTEAATNSSTASASSGTSSTSTSNVWKKGKKVTGVKFYTGKKTVNYKTYKSKANVVKVKWNKVKGATGYEVYRKGNASKKWIKIATTSKTNCVVNEVYKDYQVQIKVRAYKKVNGVKQYAPYSSVKKKTYQSNYQYPKKGYVRFKAEITFLEQNKERKANGVSALKWSEKMYAVAKSRAKQLKQNYSHYGGGVRYIDQTFKDIYGESTYNKYKRKYLTGFVGENIAWNSSLFTPKWYRSGVKESRGHYAALINTKWNYGAIAFYKSSTTSKEYVAETWSTPNLDEDLK